MKKEDVIAVWAVSFTAMVLFADNTGIVFMLSFIAFAICSLRLITYKKKL